MTDPTEVLAAGLLALLGPSHPHDEGRECGTCTAYNILAAMPDHVLVPRAEWERLQRVETAARAALYDAKVEPFAALRDALDPQMLR